MRLGFFELGANRISLFDSRIAKHNDMDRRMAKAVAGHFRSAVHGEIHFALLLHLFHVIISDMMSDRLLTHDNELPWLSVAA